MSERGNEKGTRHQKRSRLFHSLSQDHCTGSDSPTVKERKRKEEEGEEEEEKRRRGRRKYLNGNNISLIVHRDSGREIVEEVDIALGILTDWITESTDLF